MAFIIIDMQREERELTEQEVGQIWHSSETEQSGYAAHDVEEIICEEDEEGERSLWAYRVGDTWTTVPAAFESMTLNWADPDDLEEYPRRISLDNGHSYLNHAESVPEEELTGIRWEIIVRQMDDETREKVVSELAPCTEREFLARYLEIAPYDLVIG